MEMERTMRPSEDIDVRFLGSWSLVSYLLTTPNGQTEHPYGEDAVGCILYTGDGHMAAHLMRRQRAHFRSEYRQESTPDERAAAYLDYLSYCGSYTVQPGAETVTHHVEASSFPNWVGRDLVRKYRFSGDTLTLGVAATDGSERTLVWKHR